MRTNISLLTIVFFSFTATSAPQYPHVCEEMTMLAREIAVINDAMAEQMKDIEHLEQKQRKAWALVSDQERMQMEKFCIDSKNKLLNIKKTINVIFQQAKR